MCDSACGGTAKGQWIKRFAAYTMPKSHKATDKLFGDRKRRMIGTLSGHVVEIGAGAGANLKYYNTDVRLTVVEPNPFMRPHLLAEAERQNRSLDLLDQGTETIPLPDASVDAAVSTLVLCSVGDPARVLGEIARILKPGGRFVFIEHVASTPGSLRGRIQHAINPLWKIIGDGCHLTRDTESALRAASFAAVDCDYFHAGLSTWLLEPFLAGTAKKTQHLGGV